MTLSFTSIPAQAPIPTEPPSPRSPSPHVRTAAALLSLSPAQASSLPAGLSKPYIDVSSTTGQVYVVLDPAVYARRKSIGLANGNGYSSPQSPAGERREWLLIMEFEVAIERIESFSKVRIGQQATAPSPTCDVAICHVLFVRRDGDEVYNHAYDLPGFTPRSQMPRQRSPLPDHVAARLVILLQLRGRSIDRHRAKSPPLASIRIRLASPG
jgi:hypothetical protein